MSEMISLKNVSKSYLKIKAVEDISFSVKRGEILGFLGPNGAGKTTAMKMITGYMPADSGQIHVKGKDIREDELTARNAIGYLPENNPLYMDMTVDEYLSFVADLRSLPDPEKAKRKAMEKCGIISVSHRIIGHLSKGYKQRVGLAQAIIHDPEILILDEPVNGLDPRQITDIRALIKDLGREKTVILCSHILSEVEAVASRILIINQGSIVADGTIDELKTMEAGSNIIRMEFLSATTNEMVEKVKSLELVKSVETTDSKTLRIVATGDKNASNRLFNLASINSWDLSQLHIEKSSLENLFLNLIDE